MSKSAALAREDSTHKLIVATARNCSINRIGKEGKSAVSLADALAMLVAPVRRRVFGGKSLLLKALQQ
jgi:hypothetical protein